MASSHDRFDPDAPRPDARRERPAPLVPPHVAWPAFVVLLLLMSVGVSLWAVFAARSDGGAEVVERPYTAGSDLDTLASLQRTSRALGWTVTAATAPDRAQPNIRTVALSVTDGTGAAVPGLSGTATVTRPQRAAPIATLPVVPDGTDYRVVVPFVGAGLYDVAVDLRRPDGTRLLDGVRLTLQ